MTRQHGGIALRVALLTTLALLVGCAAISYARITAAPNLGAPPRGPSSGSTQPQIAATLAAKLATTLVTQPHARVSLSEQDITVIVVANNPEPAQFQSPVARVRDGLLVVSADTDLGPFSVTAVGRVALTLVTGADRLPDISTDVREIDAGDFTVPGFARDRIERRVQSSLSMQHLFGADPALSRLRPFLECVGITADSLVLGFHRPLTAAQADGCS